MKLFTGLAAVGLAVAGLAVPGLAHAAGNVTGTYAIHLDEICQSIENDGTVSGICTARAPCRSIAGS